MGNFIEILSTATNVYRTKMYIVAQTIEIFQDNVESNSVISRDIFYARTKIRDKQFAHVFANRKNINGKRLPSTMYSRKYID